MKKRILSLMVVLALLLAAIPVFPISAADTGTAVWKKGNNAPAGVESPVSDYGYGFTQIDVNDARGYIPTPNLDVAPYYMMVGMDGQYPSGHWVHLHISAGERNSGWNPKGAAEDMYISFPNPSNKYITVHTMADGETIMTGVPFMPKTAFIFKFAKEQNAEGTDVLAVYCNGQKVFENAAQLAVFGGSNLWFTTNTNVGANDTLQICPMFINLNTKMTEDLDSYYTTGPKNGCDGYSSYTSDILAENMVALYDDDGYVRTIIDSTHNDQGWGEQVGESVSTNIANTNNKISVTIVPDAMNNGNWHLIGIYDPSEGGKTFAQGQFVLRLNMSGNSNIGVNWSYLREDGNAVLTKNLVLHEQRLDIGRPFKVGFELVEGDTDSIKIYYNDVLVQTVLETEDNVAELFDMMRAENLRVGIVGNKGADKQANVIRFKVDNAKVDAKVAFDKEVYNVGDYINTTLTVKNNSDKAIDGVKVSVKSSAQIATAGDAVTEISSIAAGETVEVKQTYRAIEAGRPMHRVTVTNGKNTVFDAKNFVSINGAGWYEGDSHSHSKPYSDGSGTIAENSASAYEKGLSWLYSTDHNSISQYNEVAGVNAKYPNGDFFNIAGNEVSSFNRGHGLAYNIPYDVSLGNWSDIENQPGWNIAALGTEDQLDWGDILADIKARGGFFYPAHPNHDIRPSANIIWRFDEFWQLDGITGLEVWNGSYDPTNLRNKVAFKYWDELNVRGDKAYAISNSDAHGTAPIGVAHIKAYLPELSTDNINAVLQNGNYYGTNGPDLSFDINGTMMGDTLKIDTDATKAAITVKASDDNYPLTKVTLYKLQVTGEISEKAAEYIQTDMSPDGTQGWYIDGNLYTDTKQIVKTWDLTGQNIYNFSAVVNVIVRDGDFYRIEVESEKNTYYNSDVPGDENNIGFAYSNPIWVEDSGTSNNFGATEFTLNSDFAKLYSTASGTYYVVKTKDSILSADDLVVSSSATVTSKNYDDENGVFTVTLTAADGTVKTHSIYVAGSVDDIGEFIEPDVFVPEDTEPEYTIPDYSEPVEPEETVNPAVWKNGGISVKDVTGYSDMGYGFTKLEVTDARGYIDMPNLDEKPYYMMLGMDGLMSGRWAQLHISNGERNCNWYENNEIYIVFPNDSTSPRNIIVTNAKSGTKYNDGVTFIPQTAYIFKFAKEKNAEGTDVLVIYCNGQKVFEGAKELNVFSGSKLWFNTKGNQGDTDTFATTPLFINPTTNLDKDPDFYTLAGPKGGQHNGLVTWFNIYGLLDENMLALYNDNGYTRVVIDSTHNDGGVTEKEGESVSTYVPNPNKEFEISVIAEELGSGNWATIGIYDPANGVASFGESANTIRFNINNGGNCSLNFNYLHNAGINIMPSVNRVTVGQENTIRFELVEAEVDSINIYFNGELENTILETDVNTAELFGIMRAEEIKVGVVGHKVTEADVISFKVDNTSTSTGDLALETAQQVTLRNAAPTGLRFETTVSGVDTLPEDATVEFGTIIAPADLIETEFTHKAFAAQGKQYLDVKCVVWAEDGNTMRAVISNIKETNRNRDFAARGYAKVTFGNGTVKWLYGEQIVANMADVSAE